jgi:HlyD family secretion protein
MEAELQKLRIEKSHRARRDERSLWPWAVLVLLAVGGGVWAWQWQSAAAAPTVQTVRVRLPAEGDAAAAEAAAADTVILNATGYVMAAHKIELASKVIGRVAWVGVEMGDKIKKGEVLVRLEDDEYKARVAQAQGQLDNGKALLAELEAGSRPQDIAASQARVDQAKAELTNAEVSLKRLKGLESTGAVSPQQIDDADALVRSRAAVVETMRQQFELMKAGPRTEAIDAQRATVRQLDGALAMATIDLGNTIIRSPLTATVLERNVEVGEFVTTGFVGDRGAKGYVVSIADLNDLRVELDISQNDFAKVSARQSCYIVTDAYPDKKYPGIVDQISPEANRQKGTVMVKVKVLDPDELLKPEMNATVSFLAPRKATTASATGPAASRPPIRVPASAVRDGAVFVVEDGRAVKRTVATGRSVGGVGSRDVEIVKGLIGGEDLIVSPPESLQNGQRVKATSGGTSGKEGA